VDQEHYLKEGRYVQISRYEMETQLMWELFEQEQRAKVVLGKGKKRRKVDQYATVTTRKLPRFIRIQSNNRRLQAASDLWNRPEPSIRAGVSSRGD
jgi:hypothetical protein